MPIREDFPEAGSDYLGGESDGWEYKTAFAGSNFEQTYHMVCQFLQEEGYGDIPLPSNAKDMLLFRTPGSHLQYDLFRQYGYFHNPIKILFPSSRRPSKRLLLCIYNENQPDHLLRFHGFH